LFVLIDGERSSLGTGRWEFDENGGYEDIIHYPMSKRAFLSIVNASNVEGSFGGSYNWKLKMSPKLRQRLQALVAEMEKQ
jgi:hypothetical protein